MTLTSIWEATMDSAANAFREGDYRTGIAKLCHASWVAAATKVEVAKEDADQAKQRVLDAANSGRVGAA